MLTTIDVEIDISANNKAELIKCRNELAENHFHFSGWGGEFSPRVGYNYDEETCNLLCYRVRTKDFRDQVLAIISKYPSVDVRVTDYDIDL